MDAATQLTPEIIVALSLLAITVILLVTEVVRVDVAAVSVLVALGLSSGLPGVAPLIPANELFDGFSSTAVMSIIATMIMSAGLDKTGTMRLVTGWIIKKSDQQEGRLRTLICFSGAVVSGFVQNIGAAALFLPVVNRISRVTGISASRILMPMGFCIILGGSITMVGSSSLILLNDLLQVANRSIPQEQQIAAFHLFDVAPVGIALTITGVLLFMLLGRFLLPAATEAAHKTTTTRTIDYFVREYNISGELYELQATLDSPLVGMTILQMERQLDQLPFILALRTEDKVTVVPGAKEVIWVDTFIGVMCDKRQLISFARKYKLRIVKQGSSFASAMNAQESGIAEIVILPGSNVVGKTVSDLRLYNDQNLSILRLSRGGNIIDHEFRDQPLRGGDTLLIHIAWDDLKFLRDDPDYAVVTDHRDDDQRSAKMKQALFFFALSMLLVLFSDFPIAVSLLFGAIGMVVSGAVSMDEAYRAVSWKTVFLLGSLIPLGHAVDLSGAATWITAHVLGWMDGVATWELQALVAALATVFSLFMSNVGATVLLVPLAINLALATGADPAMFALTVGVATSNSFLLPTHQVNALIMGPGHYKVTDFIRAGSVMTVLFMVVSIAVLNLLYR